MRGHVLVENSPRCQFHDYEYVKGAERGRDHDEEVARHDRLGMIVDEGQPTLLGIGCAYRPAVLQVLLHGAGRDPDPEFQFQFVRNSFLAPGNIVSCHLSDQIPEILG